MEISFNDREMRDYLKNWGFVIKSENKTFWRREYQDCVEEYNQDVDVVYNYGGLLLVDYVSNSNYQDNKAVEVVFLKEFKKKLFELISVKPKRILRQ